MKKLLTCLILTTILILASCTGSATTDTTTDTKDLNGACSYTGYRNGIEESNISGTCSVSGNTLTMTFDSAADLGGTKKTKKVQIDSDKKEQTATYEDGTTQTVGSSSSTTITITVKTDYWEIFVNGDLVGKLAAK